MRMKYYLILFLVIIVSVLGATQLNTSSDYRVYFEPSDPTVSAKKTFDSKYALGDSLVVILEYQQQVDVSSTALQQYSSITEKLNNLALVSNVQSFSTPLSLEKISPVPLDDEDEFISDENELNQQKNHELLQLSLTERLSRLTANTASKELLSHNLRYGLFIIDADYQNNNKKLIALIANIKDIFSTGLAPLDSIKDINYSGTLALNHAYLDVVSHDIKIFIPSLILLLLVCLYVFFRHLTLSLAILGGGLLTVLMSTGVAGFMQWPIAAINAFTPVILIGLYVTCIMHPILGYLNYIADNLPPKNAIKETLNDQKKPIFYSHLTTGGGFLLLFFSPSPPVQTIGITIVFGMFFSYIQIRYCMPKLLPSFKISQSQATQITQRLKTVRFATLVTKFTLPIITTNAIIGLLATMSLSKLRIDDDVYRYFPIQHEFSQGLKALEQTLGGNRILNYNLSSPKELGIISDDALDHMKAFKQWADQQSAVKRIQGILPTLSASPADATNLRRFLNIYSTEEMKLQHWLSDDLHETRIQIILGQLSARELLTFEQEINQWWQQRLLNSQLTMSDGLSPDLLFAKLGQQNATSMFICLTLALLVISLLIGTVLKSIKTALLALVANILPLIIVFGIWAMIGGYITLGSALVLGMIMGIIVDDTLHILMRYKKLSEPKLMNIYREISPAIIMTSISLIIAMFVGLFSTFKPIQDLSFLAIAIIVTAVVIDLILLPALLYKLDIKNK